VTAVPALPAPVPEPEPHPPAAARAPDPAPAADPAIYNAVVARYPHVAPVRRELRAGPAASYEFPPRYDPDITWTSGESGGPRAGSGQGPRAGSGQGGRAGTGAGAHRASQPRADARPAPSGYNLPAPPPDYSTVIDYPGPAADYQALHPVHHEPPRDRPRRDRPGRNNAWFNRNSSDETDQEARRYLDQYRDPGSGDHQFPF
jgi:hypothetical protein